MSSKLLFSFLALAIAVVSASTFSPDRVHVIDVYKNNILFRGNEPTNSTTFVYDDLTNRMRYIALKEANITLGDFYLVGMWRFLKYIICIIYLVTLTYIDNFTH